ncbi:MAG: 4Fe-4S binding protein [Planctomycetaceae bacterium]|nr:4Fe-4S binding protein [Planctomycetaceae bacterium]
MTLSGLRLLVQHAAFAMLMYGGRFGIRLGPALPCFACPYVAGCGGGCYLMALQGPFFGLGMPWAAATGVWLWRAVGYLLFFVLLVALFGKLWCGWICPFGTLSDWLGLVRRKLRIRESALSPRGTTRFGWIKYVLLAMLVVLPPFVAAGWLPQDFSLAFCNICPGKSLLPLFAGETKYLGIDFTNHVTTVFSTVLVVVTAVVVVGSFFKDRFFCMVCPLLALMHILKPVTFSRLRKEPDRCTGCGTCRRVCPMEVEDVYTEKIGNDVQAGACIGCQTCVGSCAGDGALKTTYFGKSVLVSSRKRAAQAIRRWFW